MDDDANNRNLENTDATKYGPAREAIIHRLGTRNSKYSRWHTDCLCSLE